MGNFAIRVPRIRMMIASDSHLCNHESAMWYEYQLARQCAVESNLGVEHSILGLMHIKPLASRETTILKLG